MLRTTLETLGSTLKPSVTYMKRLVVPDGAKTIFMDVDKIECIEAADGDTSRNRNLCTLTKVFDRWGVHALASNLPKSRAVSTGRCNTGLQSTRGSLKAHGFPRALIQERVPSGSSVSLSRIAGYTLT
jgi:hypothetical protein